MEQLQLPPEFLTGWIKPTAAPLQARAEIVRLRAQGHGRRMIARTLNARSISTPTGRGPWYPVTVRRVEDPAWWARYQRTYKAAQRR